MSTSNSRLTIRGATLILEDKLVPGQTVVCERGKIAAVESAGAAAKAEGEAVSGEGRYLAAGFVDLHLHGLHRFLVDRGRKDVSGIRTLLPRYGVTSFLPTICPRPREKEVLFLEGLASLASSEPPGAEILGFHMEGPFLREPGALPPDALTNADPKRVQGIVDALRPHGIVFSVSPDFPEVDRVLPVIVREGMATFMTHTRAGVSETRRAIELGARHATHFYDVFYAPPETELGVRPCGCVEAVLADPRVSVDFILDGEHVDPVAVRMALQCKGPDRVCLVSDANVGAGLPPGRYEFVAGMEVRFDYEGGPARLTETSALAGCLAGSGLTLDRAVRNAVKLLDLDLVQAVRMANANPARVVGVGDRKGLIRVGHDADLVLLDGQLNVVETWVGGVPASGAANADLEEV